MTAGRAALRLRRWLCFAGLLVVSLLWNVGAAAARELHWRELSVQAKLDAEGRLHVVERQAMVFTGDWNGGERTFRLAGEHELTLESLTRIDPVRGSVELRSGDLELTDQYAWADSSDNVLRWRSRQPHDPPFAGTELTYVLRYQLENILVREGEGAYLLDHDFAFTEREGNIERFALELAIDPVWQTDAAPPSRWELGPLAPGQGAVLRVPLRYVGSGSPAGVLHPAPEAVRWLSAVFLCVAVVLALRRLFRRERALGRFASVTKINAIDDAWLAEHVLSLKPEVVGAAYDNKTGAAEVAAVLARMVLEKKLASRVTRVKVWLWHRDNLELSLLVPKSQLEGYERALVNGLFFSGDQTSTDAIRAHYKTRGFDPSARLDKPLREQADGRLGISQDGQLDALLPVLGVSALSIVLAVVAVSQRPSELPVLFPGLMGALTCGVLAAFLAYRWRLDVTTSALGSLRFLIPLGVSLQTIWGQLLSLELSLGASLALPFWGLSLTLAVALAARSREGAAGLALRKRLAAARRYFESELRREKPRLEDAWFPYLMALDLGRNVDRWFRAFGATGAVGGLGTPMRASSPSGSRASQSSGWTGGGGAFGGGGATGTWIAATGALASGVSAQSSGGSGGGSSRGGGSSGGGGGGGW